MELRRKQPLSHKECLQILFNYEIETIQIKLDSYTKLVMNQKCVDMKKRKEEFDKIFQERVKMEPLLAYEKEKLEVEGQQPPEYHPLFLSFHKALTPPADDGYTCAEIELLFTYLVYDNK